MTLTVVLPNFWVDELYEETAMDELRLADHNVRMTVEVEGDKSGEMVETFGVIVDAKVRPLTEEEAFYLA